MCVETRIFSVFFPQQEFFSFYIYSATKQNNPHFFFLNCFLAKSFLPYCGSGVHNTPTSWGSGWISLEAGFPGEWVISPLVFLCLALAIRCKITQPLAANQVPGQ